ncbi:heat shock protein 70kD, C-terminal domain-containing protein [Blyttiomyces helicus]|uniref:Heat shock protein 70kD, C-terminal domain-containing protein n=1 Tax=Blyttiomyces helicus TaxID=388810 RepID=A0A4P9WKJ0_9FUNG|nr:heat shock protein 70kD, C-terminal domain-containing protein [Blyttiomyces helicus]|eukprot:RKO91126.1 heat shock protein 70kD, C-terminal domain-containing protein [Blyttiomyces helicus]
MESEDPAPATPDDAAGKLKKVIRKHDLTIHAHTSAAPESLLSAWQTLEGQMAASDRLIIDTAERRNALEEYVYDTRSKLEMAWSDFIADADRSAFNEALNETESWLYGDGEDATKSVYVEKLGELKKTGDPIARRYIENDERPRAERLFREYVNGVFVAVNAGDDRYAHIAADELAKIKSDLQAKLDWLNEAIAKINSQPKHIDPAVTVEAITRAKELLSLQITPILNRPKPAPKKEEAPKPAAETKETPAPTPEAEKPEASNMDVD